MKSALVLCGMDFQALRPRNFSGNQQWTQKFLWFLWRCRRRGFVSRLPINVCRTHSGLGLLPLFSAVPPTEGFLNMITFVALKVLRKCAFVPERVSPCHVWPYLTIYISCAPVMRVPWRAMMHVLWRTCQMHVWNACADRAKHQSHSRTIVGHVIVSERKHFVAFCHEHSIERCYVE